MADDCTTPVARPGVWLVYGYSETQGETWVERVYASTDELEALRYANSEPVFTAVWWPFGTDWRTVVQD